MDADSMGVNDGRTIFRVHWQLGMAAILLTAGGAQAQQSIPGSPGLPSPRLERPDERTPAARQAEDYGPLGVRLGGFMLFPRLELEEAFNDNVFAVSSNAGPVAAFL